MFYTIAAPRLMTFLHLINAAQPLSYPPIPRFRKKNDLSKSIETESIPFSLLQKNREREIS